MRYAAWFVAGLWLTLWFGLAQLNASSKMVIGRYADGQLKSVYTVDAKTALQMQGRMFVYWPNGKVRMQADFDNGVYVGDFLEWHESGIPARRMEYALGRENGLQRGWRVDGSTDFAYEMRGGRRFGVPGTMPCVVNKGDRKLALARYLREAGNLSAKAAGERMQNVVAPELPLFNDASFVPRWASGGAPAEHQVNHFSLVDHRATSFEASKLTGRPTIVSFFFTGCSSLCPTTIAQMKVLESRLQARGLTDVRFVATTVTPLQDDIAALASYAKRFELGDAWHLLTGDVASVEGFAERSFFAKTTSDVHTERAFLLDGDRRIRGVYNATQPADMAQLVQDVARLVRAI
jgi:protein SCO1